MFDNTRKCWLDRNDDSRTQRRKKQRFIRNQNTGLEFEDEMFSRRKSYHVLWVTLNIDDEYRDDVSFFTMQGMRNEFFRRIKDAHAYARYRRRRGNPLNDDERTILHDIHGLLWRQEYGEDGGSHHLHIVALASASRRDHVTTCEELGEAWQRFTKGWGCFNNGNRYTHSYKYKWGSFVGYVHRDNAEKRHSMRQFISLYMAKVTQMPMDCDDDDKLFGARYFD